MKNLLVIASIGFALGGCAGFDAQRSAYVDTTDHAHIAAVENAARASGVRVLWINLPTKTDSAVGVVPALGEPTGT